MTDTSPAALRLLPSGKVCRCDHVLCELAEAREQADYWNARVDELEREAQQ